MCVQCYDQTVNSMIRARLPSRTRHRTYLIRKIAWRIQANVEGDLSERARKRAEELADDADIRVMAPKTLVCPPQPEQAQPVTREVQNGSTFARNTRSI